MNKVLIAILAAILISLTGCSVSSPVLLVDAIVAAAEVAVPLIPQLAPAEAYINAVAAFATFSADELSSSDDALTKTSKIVAEAATLSVPVLPANTSAVIVEAIKAVSAAVNAFVSAINSGHTYLSTHPQFINSFAGTDGKLKANPSRADKKKLAEIK